MTTLPLSVKGVLLVDSKVLLLLNERGEWELPGGRMDPGETHAQALVREFREELSVDVDALGQVDSYDFEVIPSRYVHIVTYGCRLRGEFMPKVGDEHREFGLHALSGLDQLPLPEGYRRSILTWSRHA